MIRAISMSSRRSIGTHVTYLFLLVRSRSSARIPREYAMPRESAEGSEWKTDAMAGGTSRAKMPRWIVPIRVSGDLTTRSSPSPSPPQKFRHPSDTQRNRAGRPLLIAKDDRALLLNADYGLGRSNRLEWTRWSPVTAIGDESDIRARKAVRKTLKGSADVYRDSSLNFRRVPTDFDRIIDVPAPRRSDPRPSVVVTSPWGDSRRVPIGQPGADACTDDGSKNSRSCVRVEH